MSNTIAQNDTTGIKLKKSTLLEKVDFDELDLSCSSIRKLDGINVYKYLVVLDLSHNQISDITPIADLKWIHELNLSDNQISTIDALKNNQLLQILNLSNNCIEDITPLFCLPKLEYLNLSNNPVCLDQIRLLQSFSESLKILHDGL